MKPFYVCRPPGKVEPACIEKENQAPVRTFPWAVKTINKAALKINDIALKLELAKVTKFLQEKKQHEISRFPTFTCQPDFIPSIVTERAQTNTNMQNPSSNLGVFMSNSVLSRELSQSSLSQTELYLPVDHLVSDKENINQERKTCQIPRKDRNEEQTPGNEVRTIFGNFHCQNAVTTTVLDEWDSPSTITLSKQKQKMQQLSISLTQTTQQNTKLKHSLKNIITSLNNSKFIDSSKFVDSVLVENEVELEQIERQCQELCDKDIPQRIDELKQLKVYCQTLIERNMELSVAVEGKTEEMKKYEILIFIKDEEIASGKVLRSDLENQVAKLSSQPRTPRKQYKPYYQNIDDQFSRTVS